MKTTDLIKELKKHTSHQGFMDNNNHLVFPDCVLTRRDVREIIDKLEAYEELK